jgi:hypothetical protein
VEYHGQREQTLFRESLSLNIGANQVLAKEIDWWIQKEALEYFQHHIHVLYQNMHRMI